MGRQDRLATAAHYVISKAGGELSVVKLHKTLWFADIQFFGFHSRSLTGEEYYIRRGMGPCAPHLDKALADLKNDGLVRERADSRHHRQLTAVKAPDQTTLTEEDRMVLDRICAWTADKTDEEVSEYSHGWLYYNTKTNGHMSVADGAMKINPLPADRLEWARRSVA